MSAPKSFRTMHEFRELEGPERYVFVSGQRVRTVSALVAPQAGADDRPATPTTTGPTALVAPQAGADDRSIPAQGST